MIQIVLDILPNIFLTNEIYKNEQKTVNNL